MNTPVPPKAAPDLADVIETIMPAVVSVHMVKDGNEGAGSGFVIDGGKGYIVTNNHVAGNAEALAVSFYNEEIYEATLVGTDKLTDIAVIQIKEKVPEAKVGDSDKMRLGNAVIAIGNPFGLGSTVTTGIVSGLDRDVGSGPYDNFIQTDAAINPGNSGGPLFNLAGEVIGVNTMIFSKSGASAGIGFAIPSNQVKWVAEQIIKNGAVRRSAMGISVVHLNPMIADKFNLAANKKGLYVAGVAPGGPADLATLRKGDIIQGMNGEPVKSARHFSRVVAQIEPGTIASLTIERGGNTRTVAVQLAELQPPAERPTVVQPRILRRDPRL
jgi:serine protease Do